MPVRRYGSGSARNANRRGRASRPAHGPIHLPPLPDSRLKRASVSSRFGGSGKRGVLPGREAQEPVPPRFGEIDKVQRRACYGTACAGVSGAARRQGEPGSGRTRPWQTTGWNYQREPGFGDHTLESQTPRTTRTPTQSSRTRIGFRLAIPVPMQDPVLTSQGAGVGIARVRGAHVKFFLRAADSQFAV